MFHRRGTLGLLCEELRTIEVFDRVHNLATTKDSVSHTAYASRQIRRDQIIAKIGELELSKSARQYRCRLSDIVAFVSGISWALFYYHLLR